MHSVVDWFAYAVWSPEGRLLRSLSVGADVEVMEDVGDRLAFEEPFWAGDSTQAGYRLSRRRGLFRRR